MLEIICCIGFHETFDEVFLEVTLCHHFIDQLLETGELSQCGSIHQIQHILSLSLRGMLEVDISIAINDGRDNHLILGKYESEHLPQALLRIIDSKIMHQLEDLDSLSLILVILRL